MFKEAPHPWPILAPFITSIRFHIQNQVVKRRNCCKTFHNSNGTPLIGDSSAHTRGRVESSQAPLLYVCSSSSLTLFLVSLPLPPPPTPYTLPQSLLPVVSFHAPLHPLLLCTLFISRCKPRNSRLPSRAASTGFRLCRCRVRGVRPQHRRIHVIQHHEN